jgi:hypothetical protein
MALWGITDGAESKPKYLTQEDKNNTVAKPHGWELQKAVGARTQTETLVAVGSKTVLSTALAEATIASVYFVADSYARSAAGGVIVSYNEQVNVTNGATLVVTASNSGATTATAAAHTSDNTVLFAFTVPNAANTLTIGAQTVSGTIVDSAGGATSDKVIAAGDIIDAGGAGTGGTATIAVA